MNYLCIWHTINLALTNGVTECYLGVIHIYYVMLI